MVGPAFLPFALPDTGESEVEAVVETIRSGWLTTGPSAASFEREFAEKIGGDVECVAVNSATAGLHLALEALGVGPGDEVLVPTWTFNATAEVVRYVGADVVFVDVDADTLCIDLRDAESKVTDRTRAIMPVHFAGLAVSRRDLDEFAKRHQLKVIEDAAHAFPVRSDGAMIGQGASDAVVFSFYATKTITTGEGGMVAVADPRLAARMRTMRLHGISSDVFGRYTSDRPSWQYDVVAPGFKYNLTDIAAAMGRVQLARADEMRAKRERVAQRYTEAFSDLPLQLPCEARAGDTHGWHLYVVRLLDGAPHDRDSFIAGMTELGIGTSVHFIPLHKMTYWRTRYGLTDAQFPVASAQFERVVSLPAASGLTGDQVQRVIDAVRSLLA